MLYLWSYKCRINIFFENSLNFWELFVRLQKMLFKFFFFNSTVASWIMSLLVSSKFFVVRISFDCDFCILLINFSTILFLCSFLVFGLSSTSELVCCFAVVFLILLLQMLWKFVCFSEFLLVILIIIVFAFWCVEIYPSRVGTFVY